MKKDEMMETGIATSGITVLQVAANPLAAALGNPKYSHLRLTLSQTFNSFGTNFNPVLIADNGVNMGTGYDCIDPRAHTSDPRIKGRPHRNRMRLKRALERRGFEPYANEWWHFTLRDEPYPEKYFDFPVARDSLR